MPELPVDASKFAGISEEQARTFPRRAVVGVEQNQVSAPVANGGCRGYFAFSYG